ncbi:MAG: SpoIIIAH-like family protein [Erysipelotrichaceae bacterium]|nr:SpoIIIAH-like family protein [Erysipelotrichaceae bacterium]
MNKQAFTFLTLFSLILVLSIYYIMLPSSETENVTTTASTITQLQEELDQKRDEIIAENNEIIAQESSTTEAINEALETISETKSLSEKEKDIVTMILELGYEEAYVEIDNKTIKVTIKKGDALASDASTVIKEILNLMGNEYQVEVKFISD